MKINMAIKAIKNIVFSVLILLPLQLNTLKFPFEKEANLEKEVSPSALPKVVLLDLERKYCDIKCFLSTKVDTLKFFSNTFGISYEDVYDGLVKANSGNNYNYNEFNIGVLKDNKGELKQYNSFEEGLIDFLFEFANKNPKLVNNTRVPYNGNADYVIDLIRYFSSIYTNVDYTTAVAIGASESGHYTVKYMLNCNNIFGGMGKNGLIKYKNIEFGVLSYIRLLSKNYFGKGLTTVEAIGRVYCPVYNASGRKIASPHWVYLVNSAKKRYADSYAVVNVTDLLKEKI